MLGLSQSHELMRHLVNKRLLKRTKINSLHQCLTLNTSKEIYKFSSDWWKWPLAGHSSKLLLGSMQVNFAHWRYYSSYKQFRNWFGFILFCIWTQHARDYTSGALHDYPLHCLKLKNQPHFIWMQSATWEHCHLELAVATNVIYCMMHWKLGSTL